MSKLTKEQTIEKIQDMINSVSIDNLKECAKKLVVHTRREPSIAFDMVQLSLCENLSPKDYKSFMIELDCISA